MLLKEITNSVEKETGVDILDMTLNYSRKRHIVDAKRIYGYIARNVTTYSSDIIGKFIHKDHTTILHYQKTANDLMLTDNGFKSLYYRCLKNVSNTPYEDVLLDAYYYHLNKSEYYLKQLNKLNML